MNGILLQLGLVAVLVLLNAAFSGSEIALISLREGQLQRLEQRGSRGRLLASLARDPNSFLATIQVGITLAGFLASATAAVSLAEPLQEPLGFLGRAARPVSIVTVTILLAYVTLVFGELAPKRVAMQRAEGWSMAAARPISFLALLFRPVIWLLGHSTNLAVRLMRGDPNQQREEVTDEELRDLVAAQTSYTPEQRNIISGAFEIAERRLREVLQPRNEVFTLEAELSCPEALPMLAGSGHSRAPVVVGDLDQVVGVVHLRDLLDTHDVVGARAQTPVLFPESLGALEALHQMQEARVQLAVVLNEHGGTEGIITVEDLIEELVGEIWDESDRDVAAVERAEDGSVTVPGSFPFHDLDDIGVVLPEGDYSTVAGLVLDRLGRIPEGPGDSVEVDGWHLEVLAVDRRAITRLCIRRLAGADQDDEASQILGAATARSDQEQ
ncbi:MAG: Hemolysins and related proteins containing CBS domains [uncultured Acidimicrobiales bacterium]|uniref:Hemolysins and related proteins containing CBS domains n=1 Tax=uncultured Acidimicrobiales bacterium TaxID=310071 RepID=A0A6J4HPR8_9ACTN|nr:MAG: Hemolysins and related proteins containing CBS domains [uncultured Acidimicrobiales bacterium]